MWGLSSGTQLGRVHRGGMHAFLKHYRSCPPRAVANLANASFCLLSERAPASALIAASLALRSRHCLPPPTHSGTLSFAWLDCNWRSNVPPLIHPHPFPPVSALLRAEAVLVHGVASTAG